jgi:hypothetical protein
LYPSLENSSTVIAIMDGGAAHRVDITESFSAQFATLVFFFWAIWAARNKPRNTLMFF